MHEGESGCIWIGTQNGELNKYNPRKDFFEHYNIYSSKEGDNYISSLFEGKDGSIWIGTYNKGLFRYNPTGKLSEHWVHDNEDPNSLSNDFINAIIPDDEGNLWIGTYLGLNKFNYSLNKNVFEKYFEDKNNSNSLSDNLIWNITKSKLNPDLLYIGTYHGLTILNLKTKTFSKILPVSRPVSQFSNSIGSVLEKKTADGIELWLGGYGGLIKYDMLTKHSYEWHHNNRLRESLISEQINGLMMDSSGVIWIATEGGISCLSEKILKFKNNALQNFSPSDHNKIEGIQIRALAQSENGNIFLGSSQGLEYIDDSYVNSKIVTISQFKDVDIWSVAKGTNGQIWIGTYGKGLYNYSLNTSKISHISFQSPTDRSAPYNYVKSVLEDNNGRIWVGFWGGGLAVIDPVTGKQEIFRKDLNSSVSISYNDVWKIFQDGFGRIWVGTNGGGLDVFDSKKEKEIFKAAKIENKINSNNILSICEQKHNSNLQNTILWTGTTNGLTRLKIKNTANYDDINNIILDATHYTNKNGLANNVVSGIVEDDDGNLWLTTNFGLSEFVTREERFNNFSSADGLNGDNFSEGALLKDKNGLIYAGSNEGLNIFNPSDIDLSDFHRPVIFTDFMIQNKKVKVSAGSPLSENIPYTKEIKLNYDQNSFTFYFSSLDYNAPRFVEYSYILEGFDNEWSSPSNRNYAAYTNLNPGKYILKVKATNSDKVWQNTAAEILINIFPPWWKTTWAYFSYIFLIIAGIIAIRKFQISRNELRNELRMSEFESRKHQELENLKSRFFANLSHEFRTPLMLIKGPVEQLIDKLAKDNPDPDEMNEQLKMISNNSTRLQSLIDQLLELSQLEASSIPIKAKQENIINILQGLVSSFDSIAPHRNIRLSFHKSEDSIIAWVDRDKLEKIINNLLSNAFKFTPNGGEIAVMIINNKEKEVAEIKISDTGIGIPDDQLDKIFDRFYQVDDSSQRSFGGSGIGLALVKELVELHKWKIAVKSIVYKGTEFTMSIPINDYLDEKEKVYEKNNGTEINSSPAEYINHQSEEIIQTIPSAKSEDPYDESNGGISILIVEDSSDVRKYLAGLLTSWNLNSEINTYHHKSVCILEAENGVEGLKIAVEKQPELIISDVMMPYMDGIEFCGRIKTNWETSHIPVILLTAKASNQSKNEGLETGADDYLTKPFDSKELFIRIRNLLDQRARLKEKFSKEIRINAESVTANSLDNEFLNRALIVADQNLSDNNFGIDSFAKEMLVSRSQLHRKIMAITGQPPGEFLRIFRLKKAARMLMEKKLSITQIAFEVGFNSPSHFTKAFHQLFKCNPSEFAAKNLINS